MPLKIMVVDDEPKGAQLMRALAMPLGHTVLPFRDYQSAAEDRDIEPFDVAFLGMRLPKLHGLALARRLKRTQPEHRTAIVMLTSTDDSSIFRRAFGEGADLIVVEPLQADRLRRMLDAMESPGWMQEKPAARLPIFTEVTCSWDGRQCTVHSLNISSTGMLMRPALDVELGTVIALQFKIPEVHASLALNARVVRNEREKHMGVQFIDLPREDQNAIQVYVMGRVRNLAPPRNLSELGPRRLFRD
jgi:CheY-like chemotaxis protein